MMITFKSDIGKRKKLFTQESFSHPAKMHLGMLLWVVGRYTKPGETILDPMFGVGSTMLAARYGRNVIGVELEQKFVDLAKGNWDKVVSLPKTKFGLGECLIVQGDARGLEGLLVDKIVTSPPFGDMNHPTNYLGKQKGESGFEYSDDPSNIGNLDYGKVDAVLTSPPYEASVSDDKESPSAGGKESKYGRWAKGTAKKTSYTQAEEPCKHIDTTLPRELDNIGNLRRDTYLEAMLQVYRACYNILKPNGLMILVTKDFIRKGQRILLSIDTIALCEQAGFTYEDWHQRKLTQQSFWRTLYYQKHPEVEKLDTEDILVFRKLNGDGIVDAVVTSPPYGEPTTLRGGRTKTWQEKYGYQENKNDSYGQSEGQIGQMVYGSVDAIVTSPPFKEQMRDTKWMQENQPRKHRGTHNPKEQASSNIGNLPYDGAKINDEWIKSRQGKKGE